MAYPPPSNIEINLGDDVPADEVTFLISQAQQTTELTPALATVMLTHKQLILSVLDRQIQLIKSRPQSLSDGQVTIYDKALLTLTSAGTDLENPSALLFWCEHFLGVDNVKAPSNTPMFLQEMMAVPTVLNQGKRSPRSCLSDMSLTDDPAIEASSLHRLSGTTVKSEPEDSPEPIIFGSEATDPKVKRIFTVYDQARTEYLSVADADDAKVIRAAKFLRDTAENALSMLKNANIDAAVMLELQTTCDKAKDTVVALSGGKKRKFDGPQKELVNGNSNGSNKGREDRNGGHQRGSHRGNNGRRGGRGRGRGHSGIPYGYTRRVDSYHPY